MIDLGLPDFGDATEIGRGGFGVVYRATQPSFGRTVAVKVLSVVDEETIRRFDRERLALGPVSNHPNIVQVFASGLTERGQPYLAMEFMDGGSLEERMQRQGPIAWATVLDAAVKLAGALETAHAAGITHRDLKPANVLLSAFGEPHLADFGIASIEGGEMTRSGVITASINFAPPEILDGKRPGVLSDMYSFGATIFTLMAGRAPFAGTEENADSIIALALRVATARIPDLRSQGIPTELADVVEKAMARLPEDRYQSAASLGRALQDVQRSLGIPVTALPIAHIESPDSPVQASATRFVDSAQIAAAQLAAATPPTPEPVSPAAPAHGSGVPVGPQPFLLGDLQPPTRPPGRSRAKTFAIAGAAAAVVVLAGIGAFALLSSDDPGDLDVETAAGAAAAETIGSGTEPTPAQPTEPAPPDDEIGDEPTPVPTAPAEPVVVAASEPYEGEWVTLPAMSTERQQLPAVVTSSGKIWMIGGLDAFAFATRSVEFFDPLLQTWAQCDCELPIALNHHMGATYDDLPVVLGGWVGVDDDIRAESSARVLQLQNGEWVDLPPMFGPRVAGVAVTVGNEIIVTGGQDAQGNLMTTTEIFDGTAWRLAADLPTPREHVGAATDGRFVYVAGGRLLPGGSAANVATFERYDPATDEWTTLPDMPTARGGLAVVWGNNAIIALGGESPSGVFDQVEQFSVATQSWEQLAPLQPGRHGLAAAFFRRSLYAIGGALRDSHLGSTAETSTLGVSG